MSLMPAHPAPSVAASGGDIYRQMNGGPSASFICPKISRGERGTREGQRPFSTLEAKRCA